MGPFCLIFFQDFLGMGQSYHQDGVCILSASQVPLGKGCFLGAPGYHDPSLLIVQGLDGHIVAFVDTIDDILHILSHCIVSCKIHY